MPIAQRQCQLLLSRPLTHVSKRSREIDCGSEATPHGVGKTRLSHHPRGCQGRPTCQALYLGSCVRPPDDCAGQQRQPFLPDMENQCRRAARPDAQGSSRAVPGIPSTEPATSNQFREQAGRLRRRLKPLQMASPAPPGSGPAPAAGDGAHTHSCIRPLPGCSSSAVCVS